MTLTIKERHDMILKTLNDSSIVCPPITQEKLDFLLENMSEDEFNNDLMYLQKISLIENCIIQGIDGRFSHDFSNLKLTADGFDYVNLETVGKDINSVTIKIHKNTLDNISNIIKSSNLKPEEKNKLLSIVKEKGAEKLVGYCFDTAISNAHIATEIFQRVCESLSK